MWTGVTCLPVAQARRPRGWSRYCQGLPRVDRGEERPGRADTIAWDGERDTRHWVVFDRLLDLDFPWILHLTSVLGRSCGQLQDQVSEH